MTRLQELDRDAATNHAAECTRFGHDPLDLTDWRWGELLDDTWAAEFDRRLAAWQSESPPSVPTDLGTLASAPLPR